MGKEGKRLKRCSTSTDVEAADQKDTKPLQIAERELQISETDVDMKKRKKKSESKEMKKLRKSFNEMTETMKNLQDFFMSKADLPGISLKELLMTTKVQEEEEAPLEKTEELATYECNFKTEDSNGNNDYTVFVTGLDTSLSRDDIKSALKKHFESCGCEVERVYVPIECKTGVPLGFAFIDVDDEEKAVELGRGYMGEQRLFVMMAKNQPERHQLPNFNGCGDCGSFLLERRLKRFLARPR